MSPLPLLNRIALMCLGYWPGAIEVRDFRKDKSRSTQILVVAPHMTFLDSLLIAVAFPPVPSGVGFSGIFDFPLMRSLAIAAQTIFVDRQSTESRQTCKELIQARAQADWSGPPLMIFPEGVITNGEALIQFKAGAFAPGQPVTPVCLRHRWRHYNPSGCGKNHNPPKALLRTMFQFSNFCQIDILDVHSPSDDEVKDPITFANSVRRSMAEHMQVPVTEQSYADGQLAYASRAKVGIDFEIGHLKSSLGYDFAEIEKLLRIFEQYDGHSSGTINLHQFHDALKLFEGGHARNFKSVENLFGFVDHNNSGAIELRDFIETASILSGHASGAELSTRRIELAFLAHDTTGEGVIPRQLFQVKGLGDELDLDKFSALAKDNPRMVEMGLETLQRLFTTVDKTRMSTNETKKRV